MAQLETELAKLFDDEGMVLLGLSKSAQSGRLSLRATADRRNGHLSIEDCAYLSRQIQHLISEKRLVSGDYRLEVSSPGLDHPLTEEWQFTKNIGRLLKITVHGERGPKEIHGRLVAVGTDGITMQTEKSEWNPKFVELLSAKVLPEFRPPSGESKP